MFQEDPYVVVEVNPEQDLDIVRPVGGGAPKWLNRRMLVRDPRTEPFASELGDPLQGLPTLNKGSDATRSPPSEDRDVKD